ncbi:uncharacterized protein LOC135955341 [Calliphora vicina]|uniref:uncharacterized protein LOC135955341 n=1 Tax=Calliphora vicina TaxID=7373 RepID=UPI00325BC2DC
MQELLHKYLPFSQHDIIIKKTDITKELKENCDENQLILQLARLYVTSPERIILLLSTKSITKTCQDVSDVLQQINQTVSDCIPLPQDNLYMKLFNGLDYFNSYVCLYNPNTRSNHLTNYHECLTELREDLYDCEGPPDWFEKSNEAVVCQYYNEIINCNYIKAAMLCGLKPALMLRTFSDEIMKKIVTFVVCV